MARTPGTLSRRGHSEAKAGENIGQGKPREGVNEKAKETNQRQEEGPEVSLTRFAGVLRLLPRLCHTRFSSCGLRDGRTWREGVLSLKHRRCNETEEYHRAQQSPHENDWLPGNQNVHGRPPGTKSGSRCNFIVLPKVQACFVSILPEFATLRHDRGRAIETRRTSSVLHLPAKAHGTLPLPSHLVFARGRQVHS